MVVWNSHVAENYYHSLGCCEATCSFHINFIQFLKLSCPFAKAKRQRIFNKFFQYVLLKSSLSEGT
jgi:hypothetical protein